jgi:putative protein-disulfide isomerase
MCSWCWGFAPVLDAIRAKYAGRFEYRLVVGGLRPAAQAEPLNERLKEFLRVEWTKIREVTGQPFDLSFLDREDFRYDTHPAARAVVIFRAMKPGAEFDFYKRIQRAFYAENTDVTQPEQLAALAAPFGVDRGLFLEHMKAPESDLGARSDYAEARMLGVQGFPAVVLRDGDKAGLLTYGYQPFDKLEPVLEKIVQS